MIRMMKKNKLFFSFLFLSLLFFLISIFLTALIPNNIQSEINHNIQNFLSNKSYFNTHQSFFISIIHHSLPLIVLWLLGISVIGIGVILIFFLLKILLFSWNCVFLFSHLTISNFIFIFLYLLVPFLYLILLFFLSYYSMSYSLLLIRCLILKKSFSLHSITFNYLKILFLFLFIVFLLSLFELYFIPIIISIF